MNRDWLVLRWREKTWWERGQTAASLGIALAVLYVGIWIFFAALADDARRAGLRNDCLVWGRCGSAR